jgi:hypothetical protein
VHLVEIYGGGLFPHHCYIYPHFNFGYKQKFQKSQTKDDKRDSMSEWEKRLEKPSVPLMAKGPPGPPKIVEIEKKYSAIEGLSSLQKHTPK